MVVKMKKKTYNTPFAVAVFELFKGSPLCGYIGASHFECTEVPFADNI